MINVLHLDDNPDDLCKAAAAVAQGMTEIVYSPVTAEEDLFQKIFSIDAPECVVLDVVMGYEKDAGLRVLKLLRKRGYRGAIVMLSSFSDPETISACLQSGATDFISKGYDEFELPLRILQAVKRVFVQSPFQAKGTAGQTLPGIREKVCKIFKSTVSSVLVTGESGTGKELVAGFFRDFCRELPFVAVNCAAINKDLMESELFGHVKGAFTGAHFAHAGLFAAADGGWIFLDEVARLSPSCQGALLRTLENGEIRPVGGSATKKIKVRVVSATNEDLNSMVAHGLFRGDLLQRLAGYEIHLKPLRERKDELPSIICNLVERLNASLIKATVKYELTPAAMALLLAYDWKMGNVRELWHVLQGATVEARNGVISVDCLPQSFLDKIVNAKNQKSASSENQENSNKNENEKFSVQWNFPVSLPELEDKLFLAALAVLECNNSPALNAQRSLCRELGLARSSLRIRLARHENLLKTSQSFLKLYSDKGKVDE